MGHLLPRRALLRLGLALAFATSFVQAFAAEPRLPAPTQRQATARSAELEREARELYHAAMRHRRRHSPERITLLQRAITVLTRAVALDERNAETRMLLGSWLLHSELGEVALKQAVTELLRARSDDKLGALDCEIGGLLGIVYSHLERFGDAIGEYDRALRLLPGEPDLAHAPRRQQQAMLLGNSAEALMATGRLDEAIRRYAQAEAIDRSDQSALHALGLAVALDRDGQGQKSREALSRALAADPGLRTFQSEDVFFVPEGDRHYYWGLLHEEFGNRDEAIHAFRDFLGDVPHSRYAARARSHIEELKKQPGVAVAELLRARVVVGLPQFPPDAQSGIALRRHREEADVHRVVNDRTFELRQCYARALRRAPSLRGDLLVALMLDRYGAVLLVQPLENTLSDQPRRDDQSGGPGAAELLRCVQSTVYRWRFSPADPDVVDQDELALPLRFTAP
jgi:tetratricopeptide (TPR) repeat protein